MLAQSVGSMMNLVLGCCFNYEFRVVEPFIASLLRACSNVKLCLFATNMDSRFHEVAQRFGIQVEDLAPHITEGQDAPNIRFFLYRDYLAKHATAFSQVLLSDMRDVIFQSDPFVVPHEGGVAFAAEDQLIRHDQNWNAPWVRELYGDDVLAEIGDNIVSCSGTTIGSVEGIRQYLDLLCTEMTQRTFDVRYNYDQGFHNYVVWKLRPDFGKVDFEDRIVSTLYWTNPARIKVESERIYVDGNVPPIIHQYDRFDAIVNLVASSRRFSIAGLPASSP